MHWTKYVTNFSHNLMINPTILIVFTLYLFVYGVVGVCVNHWNYIGQVAVSIRPDFVCHYSTISSTINIAKIAPSHYSYVNIESVEAIPHNLSFEIPATGSPINLTLSHETSQGLAKLPVVIKLSPVPDRPPQLPYQIYFKPVISEATSPTAIDFYEVFWNGLATDEGSTLLVYNTSHALQYNTKQTSVCLIDLTPGQVYQICVVRNSLACKQSQWSCISQTIPVLTTTKSLSKVESTIGIRSLRLVASGTDWIQLSWLPALQSRRKIFEFPDAYMIIVVPRQITSDTCTTRIYSIRAPWIDKIQLELLENVVTHTKSKLSPNCTAVLHSLKQLGNWPDWHKFIEQYDEWGGLLNEFTVDIDDLQPGRQYTVTVTPITMRTKTVQTTISVWTKGHDTDCQLNLTHIPSSEETVINWTIPISLNLTYLKEFIFDMELLHVGKPDRVLPRTCFIATCKSSEHNLKVAFVKREPPTDRLQTVRCFQMLVHGTGVVVPCLAKCKQFEISISLFNENTLVREFVCRKRFVHLGKDPRPPTYARVMSISQNMLLLQISKHTQSINFGHCSIVGYAIRFKPYSLSSSPGDNQILLTTDDLDSNLTRIKYEIDSSYRTSNSLYHLLLNNAPDLTGTITMSIQTIPSSETNKINLRLSIPSRNCYLDCIWPNKIPFTWFKQNPEYMGYRTNWLQNQHLQTNGRVGLQQCQAKHSDGSLYTTRCHTNHNLLESEFAFCEVYNQSRACFIPHCDMMAPLPCVSFKQITNITHSSVIIEWLSPKMDTLFYEQYQFKSNLIQIAGYLIVLYRISPTIQSDITCTHYQFVFLQGENLAVQLILDNLVINSLIHSCQQQPTHTSMVTLANAPLKNVYFHDLIQNTSYLVTITPINKLPQLGSGWTEKFRTKPARPCRPESVYISKVETHALTLNWNLSTAVNKCGNPTSLIIHYRLSGNSLLNGGAINSKTDWISYKLPYKSEKFRLAYLLACNHYCVQVQLGNEVGVGSKSDMLCIQTDQAPFTDSPYLTVKMLDQSEQGGYNSTNPVSVDVHFHLNHTVYCPLKYQFIYAIHNSNESYKLISDNPRINISVNIHRGLLYEIRGQAFSMGRSGRTESQWTDSVRFYANMSYWSLINFTVEARKPSETLMNDGDIFYFCPSISKSQAYLKQFSRPWLTEHSLCFQLKWNVTGSVKGLLGVVIQIYVNVPKNNSTIYETNVEKVDTQIDMDVKCAEFMWLPCLDCVTPYSYQNAHPRVYRKLKSLLKNCSSNQFQHALEYHKYEADPMTNNYLMWIKNPYYWESNPYVISLGQTSFDYPLSVANPSPQSVMKNAKQKSMTIYPPSPIVTMDENSVRDGFVVLYIANMNDVELSSMHVWNLFDHYSTSGLTYTILISLLVFGIIIFWILVCLFTLLIIYNIQHRRRLQKTEERREEEYCYEMHFKLPVIPLKIGSQPDSIKINEFVTWFTKHSGSNSSVIRDQFKLLKHHSYQQEKAKRLTCSVGRAPENRIRNRYQNLLPFDENYVHLKRKWQLPVLEHLFQRDRSDSAEDNSPLTDAASGIEKLNLDEQICSSLPNIGPEQWIASDYVNASPIPSKFPGVCSVRIDAHKLPYSYIAAQAPVTRSRSVFWQMIWDHEVKLIIMLTCVVDDNKEKCSVYWPTLSTTENVDSHLVKKDRTIYVGRFEIYLIEEVSYNVYVKRKMRIVDLKNPQEEARFVTQLHMLKWPDFSTPSVKDFILFLRSYWTEKYFGKMFESPVLVHCSAGIGRTGTFITLDSLCQHVRNYLQSDHQFALNDNPNHNEPMYANLKTENAYSNLDELTILDSVMPDGLSQADSNARQSLLSNSIQSNSLQTMASLRKRKFLFGRGAAALEDTRQSVNIYKIILWLRGHRSRMVDTYDQYYFIYECLSSYIQQLKETDQIYENI